MCPRIALIALSLGACTSKPGPHEAQPAREHEPAAKAEPLPAAAPGSELSEGLAWTLVAEPQTVTMAERETVRLTIEVTNEGSETVDPKQHLGQFELDGERHLGLGMWFGNGLRSNTWTALPPGETASDARVVGEQLFVAPGEYVVGFRYGDAVATARVSVRE